MSIEEFRGLWLKKDSKSTIQKTELDTAIVFHVEILGWHRTFLF